MWKSTAPCLNHVNNTILYIMKILNRQTIYLDKWPAHWFVHFCVGFLFFVRFPLSAALSLTIRSVVDASLLLCGIAEDVLLPALHLGKVKVWARHPPVDVLDVIAGGLKVSCGVVWAGDENLKGRKQSETDLYEVSCQWMSQETEKQVIAGL